MTNANGLITVTADNALGTGTVRMETLTGGVTRLQLSGVTLPNDIELNSGAQTGFQGALVAIGDAVSTVNGDVTVFQATGNGGNLAATGTSELVLNGELNVDGGHGVIVHRVGTVVYAGGGSTAYGLAIGEGTARLGASNGISTQTTLTMAGSGPANFDLDTYDQTLQGLIYTAENAARTMTIRGSGTLTIDAQQDTQLGPGGALDGARNFTANFSDLENFVWNGAGRVFRVGLRPGSSNVGGNTGTFITELAKDNSLTALRLSVGDLAASNHGGSSFLRLGETNLINADTINIGASGRSNATLIFRDGLVAPTATIRGTNGVSSVALWDVGRVSNFATNVWTSVVDFSAGTVDAKVQTMRVGIADTNGSANRQGIQNSTFTMGAGLLEVETLIVGQLSGTSGNSAATFTANGTFNLGHAGGLVRANQLIIANNIGVVSGGTRTVNGVFNLNAGTLEVGAINRGAQTGIASSVSATLGMFGGVLRPLPGEDLLISEITVDLLDGGEGNFGPGSGRLMTIADNVMVTGTGTLRKSGAGTLVVNSANLHPGATSVTGGTLVLNEAALHDDSTVRLATGGILNLPHGQVDTIARLFVNGVQQSAGTYHSGNLPLITGTGSLLVLFDPSGNSYTEWASDNGLDGSLGKEAGFGDDPDEDVFPNGLEWILNGDPLAHDSAGLVEIEASANGGLTLRFDRNIGSLNEADLWVDFGGDLRDPWKSAIVGAASTGPDLNGVTVEVVANGNYDQVTVVIPASNAINGKLFARVRAMVK